MASAPETAPSTKSSAPPPPPAGVGTAPPPIGSNSTAPPPPGSSPPPLVTSPPPPSPPPTTPPPPPPVPENSSVQPPTPPPPSSPPPPTTNSPPPTPLPSGPPSSSSPPSTQSPPSPPSPATKPSPSVPSNSAKNSTSPPKGVPNVPPSRASPLPKDDSSKVQSSDGQSEADLPLVIGVSLGVGVFMALMIVALVLCARSRKKKKPFYYDHAAAGTEGGFYPGGPHPKWQNGPAIGGQHIGKIPPPPGGPNGGAWAYPQMPPAPAMMYSGEMSSGGFSNPHGTPVLPPPSPGVALGFNKGTFTYDELAAATNGFSQANLLGQGGFGYVFKGVLPNGKEVAVKQLKADSGQGEREFHAEVEIISRVHHRHLVSLVGYCITGQHRLLVYEFVPNKTLEYHLYGKGLPTMDWPTRLKIALGSAKGLSYLHEDCHPRIIHRDIKAANILIDYKFEAMVADFGLAKLSEDTNTHVSTRIMGTFGYLAPEYASTGKLTEKSDVFSFGVMLLELITGRRPIDRAHMEEDSLVDWARPLLTQALSDDNFEGIVDPRLENNYNTMEMERMIACAAASVRHSARRRPKMSQIVRALEGDVLLDDLNEGVKPGQSVFFSSSGSDGDYASYNTRMKQFRRAALGTSDDFSKGYSGVTSEYGLNPSESSSSGEMSTTGSTRGNTGTRV